MRFSTPCPPNVALVLCLSIGSLACSGGANLNGDGGTSTPVTIIGGSVGDTCGMAAPCRTGIFCVGGTCAPPMGSADGGASCQSGPECGTGNCGPSRTCDPAGTAALGASCVGDADCSKGLRCAFDGSSVFPKCIPGGSKDYKQACTATRDCFQGLTCNPTTGKCDVPPLPPGTMLPHGLPPYIPSPTAAPWPGGKCPLPVTGVVTARFHVPRASDAVDGDFYKLPFPNDAARDATGHVSYANHPHDPSPPVGFDVLKPYLDALSSEPFGNYPTAFFTFNGQFDFNSISTGGNSPQLRWVDLSGKDTDPGWGQRLGFNYLTTNGGNKYICPNYLAVRPPRGQPLKAGGVYAIIVLSGVKAAPASMGAPDGPLVLADSDLVALLSGTPPTDAALTGPYAAYAPLRDYLSKQQPAIDPSQVVTATVFTVGNPQAAAALMRPSVQAALAVGSGDGGAPVEAGAGTPMVHNWTLCTAGATSPCPQHDGARNCGAMPAAGFDEYHALVDLPIFQQGTAPYAGATGGGNIDVSQAIVAPVRTESVCMALTVPKGAAPTGGWPVVIYAHGTGGSFRSHAIDGSAAMLSNIDLGGGVMSGFAMLGIDQIGHGPRRCGGGACTSTASPSDVVFNFGNPQAARYNYIQGAADQHALLRVAETLAIDPAVATSPVTFNPSKPVYWGHSQGATEGALFLATDGTVPGAVLSGEAGGFIESLLTKVSPVDIKDGLWVALSESSPDAVNIYHPVLSLLQNWIDPADPIHFAALDVKPATAMGAAMLARNIFQPSGTGDTYTAFPVQITYATAAGLTLISPVVDELNATVATNMTSVQGNVQVGALMATATFRQYAPASYDGHFVATMNPTAQADVEKFLARVAMGQVPKVPE